MIKEKELRLIIYTILTLLILWLILTGRTLQYLHPSMRVFQIFALTFLLVLTAYNWIKFFKENDQKDLIRFKWTTMLPFLLFFVLIVTDPNTLSAEAKQNKSLQIGEIEQVNVGSSIEDTYVRELSPEEESLIDSQNEEKNGQFEDLEVLNEDNKVGATSNNSLDEHQEETDLILEMPTDFLGIVAGMYETPNLFLEERVVLEGFVYRDESFAEGSIVVGRLLITCCIADATIAGLYLEPENAENYITDSWIRVEGRVVADEKYMAGTDSYMDIYTLEDMIIEEIEPLEDPYVYWVY